MNDLHTKVIQKQFAVHWKRLGLKLGLSNDRMEIISYNYKHSPNRAQDCCIAMFEEWLRDVPSPTWGLLSDCIIEIMTGDDINISTSVAYRTSTYTASYTVHGKILGWENIGELWAFCKYFTCQLFLLVIQLATEVTKQLPFNLLNVSCNAYYSTSYLNFSY